MDAELFKVCVCNLHHCIPIRNRFAFALQFVVMHLLVTVRNKQDTETQAITKKDNRNLRPNALFLYKHGEQIAERQPWTRVSQ